MYSICWGKAGATEPLLMMLDGRDTEGEVALWTSANDEAVREWRFD